MSYTADIAARIVTEIEELSLVGSPEVQARKRMWADDGADDKQPMHRGITISPSGDDAAGGTSDRENVAYRYGVMFYAGSSSEFLDDSWSVADWSEAVRRRFQFRRIGSLPSPLCELHCVVGRSKRPVEAQLEANEDLAVFEITCFVREPRNV